MGGQTRYNTVNVAAGSWTTGFLILCVLFTPLLFSACNSTKYVAEDEYLLNKTRIVDDNKNISRDEYRNYIKQKPNKRVLFWKFYLSLYNLSRKDKDTGLSGYLKRIGEPPVVFDPGLTDNSREQLELLLQNKGYFNAEVKDSVVYKKEKANVTYIIQSGKPYTIRNIDYFFEDARLADLVMTDTASSLISPGDRYDVDALQNERIRIEQIMRNNGYYNFSRDFVYYQVDSALRSNRLDITLGIRNYPVKDERGRIRQTAHSEYTVDKVFIRTNYDMMNEDRGDRGSGIRADTLEYAGTYIINQGNSIINPGLVTQKNYIMPGEEYNASRVQRTYRNLSSLSAYRLVDINFSEDDSVENGLIAEINMFPAIRQAFSGGIEGTNSEGNIGARGNLSYQHRNLFGGSEQFEFTITGAIETLRESNDPDFTTMQEIGAEARLDVPQFLLPFRTEQFIRRFNPRTTLNLVYSYQKRPDFTRSTFRGGFGYQWRGNRFLTHNVYPFEISLINTPFVSDSFALDLEGTYLKYAYQPHFITNQRYTMVFTNQRLNKETDFQYLRFNVETAGNLFYGLYSGIIRPETDSVYRFLGVDIAQYFKADVEFRHYENIDEGINLVYRGFIGASIPYLNSTAIPFEKQFFAGGSNSLRAWRVKSLGPGTYDGGLASEYPNQTADLKLEANVEYRFGLFWKLEGAFFVDAGNIWSLSKEDDREGALFNIRDFYREFAVGGGFGTRLDFNFFLLRFDIGIQLVDPTRPLGQRWLPGNSSYTSDNFAFNIAIGYPF